MQRKESIKINIYTQITAEDSEKKCCGCWEMYVHKTKENTGSNVRDAETDFISSVLYTNRKASTAVEGFCRRKPGRMQKII